jgi:Flp pilus assembly protein TadD
MSAAAWILIMSLEQQFLALQQKLAAVAALSIADINAATDFAIDANDARRADLTLALLEPLATRAPHVAKIWQLLGLAWREEQDMARATTAFDRAVALAPQDPRIALGKAQVAFESGRPSAHLFKGVRAVAPDDGELALSAAAALVHDGKSAVGEKLLLDMLAREPAWLRGLDALATMRWTAGDWDHFDQIYGNSVSARPQDLNLRLAWLRAVSQVAQWDKAEAIIANSRRSLGDRIELDAIEAHVATEKGDDDRAELLFNKAAALDDPGTKISHVRHCLRTGRVEQAEQICLKLTGTSAAPSAWPYLSTIWRLNSDPRAEWLDGDTPCIRHFDLPISATELDALAERLRGLHLTTHHPPEQSLRGGTQTQGHLFLRLEPELRAVKAMILEAVHEYVAGLPPFIERHPLLGTPRGALLFEGAWSVRLGSQGFHVVHTHPVGWISSAFYVALPDHMGNGQAGWLQLGAPPQDLRLTLPPYRMIEPKPGRLALFPSTMWHGTLPFDNGERLTIAFDIRSPAR